MWFGKGAVLSLKAVPGYDFVLKKEEKKKGVGNFLPCMCEKRNAIFHIQLLIAIQESNAFLLKSLNENE